MQTTEPSKPADAQSFLTDKLYVVRLESGVWLANGRGDPPRTLVREHARIFKNLDAAALAIVSARKQRDFKRAEIEAYNEPSSPAAEGSPSGARG